MTYGGTIWLCICGCPHVMSDCNIFNLINFWPEIWLCNIVHFENYSLCKMFPWRNGISRFDWIYKPMKTNAFYGADCAHVTNYIFCNGPRNFFGTFWRERKWPERCPHSCWTFVVMSALSFMISLGACCFIIFQNLKYFHTTDFAFPGKFVHTLFNSAAMMNLLIMKGY